MITDEKLTILRWRDRSWFEVVEVALEMWGLLECGNSGEKEVEGHAGRLKAPCYERQMKHVL